MTFVTLSLFMAAKILYTVIVIFLFAIPSGMGLGVGLHVVKRFFSWRGKKKTKTTKQRAENYKDFLSEEEIATAGGHA